MTVETPARGSCKDGNLATDDDKPHMTQGRMKGENEMKFSEMSYRQKLATKLAWESCGWVVGGYENSMTDFAEDTEDYQSAKAALADHDELVREIYDHLMSYTEAGYLKHLRFVGKAFILERIENRLKKWGY